MSGLKLEDFVSRTFDKIRYGDTDRQGHVNNAVFVSYLETGRVDLIAKASTAAGAVTRMNAVLARLELDCRGQIFWPGTVEVGSAVIKVGRSSVTFTQGLFQANACVAAAISVVVQVDAATGRPVAIGEQLRAGFEALRLTG